MKTEIQSKKGLRTILSVSVDKETIQKKMDERLNELQKEVSLKGFRTGKVPTSVIKNQFGKSIYGEVIDKILRETSTKAIEEKKIWKDENTSEKWKEENLKEIQKRLNGWQLESFKESYEHKVKEGISIFKKENLK